MFATQFQNTPYDTFPEARHGFEVTVTYGKTKQAKRARDHLPPPPPRASFRVVRKNVRNLPLPLLLTKNSLLPVLQQTCCFRASKMHPFPSIHTITPYSNALGGRVLGLCASAATRHWLSTERHAKAPAARFAVPATIFCRLRCLLVLVPLPSCLLLLLQLRLISYRCC